MILVVSRSSLVNLINDLLPHYGNRLLACEDNVDVYEKCLVDRKVESSVQTKWQWNASAREFLQRHGYDCDEIIGNK